MGDEEFLVCFLLSGDIAQLLTDQVCGVEVAKVRMAEDDRPYLLSVMPQVPETWFDPGTYALSVRLDSDGPNNAVRAAWQVVKRAASFLATYVRLPRPGLDLQRQRLITPTGWVMAWHRGGWELVSYQTWLLMTISLPGDVGKVEVGYDENLFRRLAEASNLFWASNQREEDRLRIERATAWYGLSLTAGEYAAMLLHGWMAIVPLVIGRKEHTNLMLDRLVQLARRHGHDLDRGLLEAIREARNEIAHEGSMANADPLAVHAGEVAQYLHPLRLLFVMSLLFALEMMPLDAPLLDKWQDVDAYQPSIIVDDATLPVWHAVPELLGSLR